MLLYSFRVESSLCPEFFHPMFVTWHTQISDPGSSYVMTLMFTREERAESQDAISYLWYVFYSTIKTLTFVMLHCIHWKPTVIDLFSTLESLTCALFSSTSRLKKKKGRVNIYKCSSSHSEWKYLVIPQVKKNIVDIKYMAKLFWAVK